MRVYLDASVLVALHTSDPLTPRADAFFRDAMPIWIVSDFAAAEFASALGRRVRTGEIDAAQAQQAFANLDRWTATAARPAALGTADIAEAARFLRRLDTTLRTPDALNIAICRRVADALATFDQRMAAAARTLGVPVAPA